MTAGCFLALAFLGDEPRLYFTPAEEVGRIVVETWSSPPELELQDPPPAQDHDLGRVFVKTGEALWFAGKTLVWDSIYILASPLRIREDTLLPTLGVLGAIGFAYLIDESVRAFAQRSRSEDTDSFFAAFETTDESRLYILGGTIALGFMTGETWVVEMGFTAWEGVIITAGLYSIINPLAGRRRPEDSRSPAKFIPFSGNSSFPSGHVIHIAPIVAVFSAYMDSLVFDLLAYTALAFSAWQRINNDKHWLSDVAASAAIGIAVGYALADLRRNPDARIIPWASWDGEGVVGGLAVEFRR
jgi:membrane-associated phospholipid phosphatase